MKHYLLVLVVTLLFAMGCGENCAVTGKVTFPDGTPCTVGKVVFETDSFYATGPLRSDGTYTMGSIEPNDGVPKGTYRVCLHDVVKVSFTPPAAPVSGDGKGAKPTASGISVTPPSVDNKFLSGSTSGLTCEVKGRTKFDFTVEPPTPKKKK